MIALVFAEDQIVDVFMIQFQHFFSFPIFSALL